ncbi:aspartate aminotransferase family protein [Lachnoclostridium sp. An181]|uniref:aspartate aminotransferase family protein n=1 Tax=Lachnoclostridium sp. An181 TaxID=1965575 RepID=UPI000B36EC6E|nr:aspartate aminotransferase family protein [Lachnoclostridium sp. An181]OUP51322.1 aspartate aminotransferase family protein [Lachnoclostridium sp. An181]
MENKEKQYMEETQSHLVHTYNPFPIVVKKGEGVYLYDEEGNKYLDFTSGYAVSSLGYGNKELNKKLKAQIDNILHTSNLFYHTAQKEAAERLLKLCGMDRLFFTNSGGEAVEGALKAARKYGFEKKSGRYEFIAMKESFHGRSFGALSVTGHDAYRTPFEPLLAGVKFAAFNDLDSVRALVNEKTLAIIFEPVQGEGGVYPAKEEFVKGIRKLCDENDILMICDEVQCGMGRTGNYFAWQGYKARPDILTMAKAIGNGIPVGAFALTEKVAKYSLSPGDHGSTYGGGPLACTAVSAVAKIFEKKNLPDHVKEISVYLEEKLDKLKEECPFVTGRRGVGLLQAVKITKQVKETTMRALGEGLLVIGAGDDAIRLIPPLVIEKEHVDEMIEKLKKALEA